MGSRTSVLLTSLWEKEIVTGKRGEGGNVTVQDPYGNITMLIIVSYPDQRGSVEFVKAKRHSSYPK